MMGSLCVFATLATYESSRRDGNEFLRMRLVMTVLLGLTAAGLILRTGFAWFRPAAAPAQAFYDPLNGVSTLVISLLLAGLSISLMMMAGERTSGRHRRLALTDDLTGLPNRRYFLTQADRVLRRARNDVPVSILMMDLDHFSEVNERFGHAGGDAALVRFAELLRRRFRSSGLVARYGGEEFCALLPGTSESQALGIANALRADLASSCLDLQGLEHTVTVSIGVAAVRNGDLTTALHEADAALYRAKGEGRNRVAGRHNEPDGDYGLAAG
jgi:diguanylate cyclase (GGDEF)-like protein